jgi:hypothetical protein
MTQTRRSPENPGRFRERWERSVGNPYINEGPQPIKDPSGQLHIVYSANGSWSTDYCLGDLRLASGGDPTNPRAWYKSEGCLFGAKKGLMAKGLESVRNAKGVGHHSFLLPDGDINASPAPGVATAFLYHGVPNSLQMSWSNRYWYNGTFTWTENTTYCRSRSAQRRRSARRWVPECWRTNYHVGSKREISRDDPRAV